MRLVVIGDIHWYRLLVKPWWLLGKRIIGQANLWFNRRHHFDLDLLPPLLERASSLEPDLLLFSGDLTTTALNSEFRSVVRAMQPLLGRFPAVVVPGNHDRYTFTATRRRNMERAFGSFVPEEFPHFRVLDGRWHLLALNAAVPRMLSSRGRVGEGQLDAAARQIDSLRSDQGLVVLCHYPVGVPPQFPPMPPSHRLEDVAALVAMLRGCPARTLYVHGHVHEPWLWRRKDEGMSHVIDVNAGAPCMRGPRHPHGQGFWHIDLPADSVAETKIRLVHHALEAGESDLQWTARDVE